MARVSVASQFKEIITNYPKELQVLIEKGLDEASAMMEDALRSASPQAGTRYATGEFANSWSRKMQYKNVRYVGNTKVAPRNKAEAHHKGGIPLSSLLEYGRNGSPFINRTVAANRHRCYKKVIDIVGGKN